MPSDTATYKRRKILVDKKFQLQFFYIWLITAVVMVALSAVFYVAVSKLMRMDLPTSVIKISIGAAAFILLYTILMGLMTVILTHRVAGAAYRLEGHVKKVLTGDFSETVHLRRTDYLRNFAEYLNILTRALQDRREKVQKSVDDLSALQSSMNSRLNADERQVLQRVVDTLSSVNSVSTVAHGS